LKVKAGIESCFTLLNSFAAAKLKFKSYGAAWDLVKRADTCDSTVGCYEKMQIVNLEYEVIRLFTIAVNGPHMIGSNLQQFAFTLD
jgi:hypothetical protein